MNKLIKLLLSLLLTTCLIGCSTSNDSKEETEDTSTTQVEDNNEEENEKEEDTKDTTTTKKETSTKVTVETINIESDSIVGSNYVTAISSTSAKTPGSNQSPGIVFDAIDGASEYCIYMIDTTASNWLHWKATGLTEVCYQQGSNVGQYVGPYPPSGTHTYVIHVFALANKPDGYPGNMDSKNSSIDTIQSKLDVSSGNKGNVIGHGSISAKVVSGGEVIE